MSETEQTQEELVKKVLAGVAKYTVDGETIESHDIEQQLKAIEYLQQIKASKSKNKGLRFFKLSTPGPEK